jgi:hypothetical protein
MSYYTSRQKLNKSSAFSNDYKLPKWKEFTCFTTDAVRGR